MEEIQQFHSLKNFKLNQNKIFLFKKCIWKWYLRDVSHFVGTSTYQSRRQPANEQWNLIRAHQWEKWSGHYKVLAVAELKWTTYSGQYKPEQLERLCSEIPPTTTWLPIIVIHIRSQVKTRQIQSCKFEKNAKKSSFGILQETLHTTHLLKMLDKMYKYEMDPTRPVGTIERTRDAGRTDGRMDGVKPIYPPTTSLCGGYN